MHVFRGVPNMKPAWKCSTNHDWQANAGQHLLVSESRFRLLSWDTQDWIFMHVVWIHCISLKHLLSFARSKYTRLCLLSLRRATIEHRRWYTLTECSPISKHVSYQDPGSLLGEKRPGRALCLERHSSRLPTVLKCQHARCDRNRQTSIVSHWSGPSQLCGWCKTHLMQNGVSLNRCWKHSRLEVVINPLAHTTLCLWCSAMNLNGLKLDRLVMTAVQEAVNQQEKVEPYIDIVDIRRSGFSSSFVKLRANNVCQASSRAIHHLILRGLVFQVTLRLHLQDCFTHFQPCLLVFSLISGFQLFPSNPQASIGFEFNAVSTVLLISTRLQLCHPSLDWLFIIEHSTLKPSLPSTSISNRHDHTKYQIGIAGQFYLINTSRHWSGDLRSRSSIQKRSGIS